MDDLTTALARFDAVAKRRGWDATDEEGGRAVRRDGAGLRLTPGGAGLLLQITHGVGPHVGWLDIWTGPASGASVDDAPTLDEALAYGFDLMEPDDRSSSFER